MLKLLLFALIGLSSLLFYKSRFTSKLKIGGMHVSQLYYLVITPLGAILLIALGMDILARPQVATTLIPQNVLFALFVVSVVMAAMGVAIHSAATSVYLAFKENFETEGEAFHTNEIFHGSLSHNLLFIGTILSVFFLSLLEVYHPVSKGINIDYLISLGILLGLIQAIGVLWSGRIDVGYSLGSSFICSLFLLSVLRGVKNPLNLYPDAVVFMSALITLSIVLGVGIVVLLVFDKITKRVVKQAFPRGHYYHKSIYFKFLNLVVEKKIS